MNPFKYSDDQISEREFMIAFPSILIGVAILSLPGDVAKVTSFSDGWVSILVAGIAFTVITILAVRLTALFPDDSFLTYTSFLVSRPVAIGLTLVFVFLSITTVAYAVRSIAFIAQQYIFDQTPMDVLALSFLLIVVYAVSGTRAGIFRLNVLFLPIILFAFVIVGLFNLKWFEPSNLFPLFTSDWKEYFKGMKNTFGAFSGFGFVLFYFFLINKPTQITKKVIVGMSISIIFYLMIFLVSIGIFGNAVTGNLQFPTIELAKRVDIPGAILERIDAIVFTIWIMAIFNTAAVTYDIAVLLLNSIFTKTKKRIIVFTLSPLIFFLALFPQELDQVNKAGDVLSVFYIIFTCGIILCLLALAKVRGVKKNAQK